LYGVSVMRGCRISYVGSIIEQRLLRQLALNAEVVIVSCRDVAIQRDTGALADRLQGRSSRQTAQVAIKSPLRA
jgi:hypothetical protein